MLDGSSSRGPADAGDHDLQERDERFRAFVTASADVVFRMSADWSEMRELDSRGFLADTAEPNGTWMDRYFDLEDQAIVRIAVARAIALKEVFELEHRVRRVDGTFGWTLSRAVPVLRPDGEIREWLGAATDITDKVRAQAALRESEALRRIALSGGRMGSWRWDLASGTVRGDPQFLALWGFPPSDEPLPLSEFIDRQSPEGVIQTESIVVKAIDAGEEFDAVVQVASGPMAGRWLRWRGQAEPGNPSVLYGVSFDITDQKNAEAVLRESEERQTFLLKLSDALRWLSNPDELRHAATRVLCQDFGVTRANYYEVADDQEHFRVSQTFADGDHVRADPQLRFSTLGFLGPAYRAGQTLIFDDIATDPRLGEATRAEILGRGARASIMVPLVKGRRLLGMVGVHHQAPRAWTGHEVAMVEETAERTWAAVERARAIAELGESERRQAFLLHVSDALRSLTDEDTITAEASRLLGEHIGADRTFLTEVEPDGMTLLVRQEHLRSGATSVLGRYSFDMFGGFVGRELHAGRVLAVEDVSARVDLDAEERSTYAAIGIAAYLLIPLIREGRLAAYMTLNHRVPRRWSEADLAVARQVADRTWAAVAQARAEERIRASERFSRALVEGVPQLVWRAVEGGEWTWASPQWTQFTGQAEPYSRGHGWLEPVHPEDREGAIAHWQQAEATGKLEMDLRLRNAASGRYHWFQTRARPVHGVDGVIVEWLGTSTDIDDLRHLQGRQQILVAELQHRVRNILTVVRSVFTRTAEGDAPFDQVVDRFRGRLDNLARTQVIVTQSASGAVYLRNLIHDELMSVDSADSPHVTLDGPDVALDPETAESISLAIHELTTNAVKYGALKVAGATLEVRWVINSDYGDAGTLDLTWKEQGVPAVPVKPVQKGFGSELIEEALPYRLGAETKLEFRDGGVRCAISVPLTEVAEMADVWENR